MPYSPIEAAVLEEREKCAAMVEHWADEVEREKATVGEGHLRHFANALRHRSHYFSPGQRMPAKVERRLTRKEMHHSKS